MFLAELGKEGVGEEIDLAEGFALFFRMSVGGACIGIAFGIMLVSILYLFNRRLSAEENVLQVASTITIAYACYYVADAVAHTSGVIAVVFCGVFSKAFGASLINDMELLDSFWVLVEHLLNTLLFALGGAVWGSIISNADPREFSGTDWGYLILLYVLLTAIRFFLVGAFYPIISSIGLKSSVKEAIFMSYGGLRGAVGISLAIALDNEVFRNTNDPELRDFSTKLFGMIGGIAFLTLFINGSTAGLFLKKLGLTRASEVRERLLKSYYRKMDESLLDSFVHLLANPVFKNADFALVRHHVPFLEKLDLEILKNAVLTNRDNVSKKHYRKPNLNGIIPYLLRSSEEQPEYDLTWLDELEEYETNVCLRARDSFRIKASVAEENLETLQAEHGQKAEAKEYRLIFLEILKAAYGTMIEKGNLDVRAGSPGFVAFVLDQGIEFAIDSVNNGRPLQDWKSSFLVSQPLEDVGARCMDRMCRPILAFLGKSAMPRPDRSKQSFRLDVNRAIAFLEAHITARRLFEREFCSDGVNDCQKLIIKESLLESDMAQKTLDDFNKEDVRLVLSHALSLTMLNKASRFVEKLLDKGLLHETEATEKIEEIEHHIQALHNCAHTHHPGQLSQYEKQEVLEKQTTNHATNKV